MFKKVIFIYNKPYTAIKYSLNIEQRQIMKGVLQCSCFLQFIPLMQSNLHIESSVYLHAAWVHFSYLLEAESSSGYPCSVPFR